MRTTHCAVLLSVALSWTQLSPVQMQASAPDPALDDVLQKVRLYLAAYEGRLSGVMAREHYEQRHTTRDFIPPMGPGRNVIPPFSQTRVLTSDFIFLRSSPRVAWLGLRDTFEVDGKAVRNADARLVTLLSDGRLGGLTQAERVSAENARYNIGTFPRTINAPTYALDLLGERHRTRFTFRRAGTDKVEGHRLWRVEFRETTRPSLVQTREGRDQPVRGAALVDPASGTVWQTVLDLSGDRANNFVTTKVTVYYGTVNTLKFVVPTEMVDYYSQPPERDIWGFTMIGRATYDDFRTLATSDRVIPDR